MVGRCGAAGHYSSPAPAFIEGKAVTLEGSTADRRPVAIIARLRRLDLIVHSTVRMVFWLCGYLAFEWLFHATKPSLVSSAPPSVQLLLLIATPAVFLAWTLPAQVLLAGLDSLRHEAKVRWLAALIPALISTVLFLMLAENFSRTVFDYGIADTRGSQIATVLCLVLLLGVALWMWQSEGLALARSGPRRGTTIAAAAAVLLAVIGSIIAARPAGTSVGESITSDAARRPNVLLVGLDSVTARMTSAYGAPPGSTPNLDALARRGILVENAFSNAGRTYTSISSILTGKSPIETPTLLLTYLEGEDSVEHLPFVLHAAGYESAQVGIEMHVDANDLNMKGGFDLVNGRPGLPGRPKRDISKLRDRLDLYRGQLVERVTDRVPHILLIRMMHDEYRFLVGEAPDIRRFLDARRIELSRSFILRRREPWFLHLHLADAHGCTQCESDVREVDASLGQVIDAVRATGQLDRTLVIVYSDHSETWGTTDRLPLVIVPPGGVPAHRIRNNAQLVDIAPTILDYLGVAKPDWMSGVSLFDGEPEARRPILSVAPFSDPKLVGVVMCDRWATLERTTLTFRSGHVENHTAPCAIESAFDAEARSLLTEALHRNASIRDSAR